MLKITYVTLIVAYAIMFASYLYRTEISYRVVNLKPNIVEQRDLTFEEYKKEETTIGIRKKIRLVFICFSCVICLASAVIWHWELFTPLVVPKIVFFFSGFWAIVLIIANGIGFIPSPPIR